MSGTSQDWFAAPDAPPDDEVLYVDVTGYEGPLDLLLDLARRQKVDLGKISVLALAEQYLLFIETVREKRIEIAADYLVMAAWLAYLKSRLMVPHAPSDEEPSGEMMAAHIDVAASPSRFWSSAGTSGKRRSTTCSRPMRPAVSAACRRTITCSNAASGRCKRPARSSQG